MCAVTADDLTAAAMIRVTAMRLFAERGADAVTLREIAAEAGVSPSLIIHHYGSKAALKRAVDDRATSLLEACVREFASASAGRPDGTSLAAALSDVLAQEPVLPSYVRRLLVEGGPPAGALFRSLFDATRASLDALTAAGLLRPTGDPAMLAALLVANDLAVVLLREQLRTVTGVDLLTPPGIAAWTASALEIYSRGIFVAETATDPKSSRRGRSR